MMVEIRSCVIYTISFFVFPLGFPTFFWFLSLFLFLICTRMSFHFCLYSVISDSGTQSIFVSNGESSTWARFGPIIIHDFPVSAYETKTHRKKNWGFLVGRIVHQSHRKRRDQAGDGPAQLANIRLRFWERSSQSFLLLFSCCFFFQSSLFFIFKIYPEFQKVQVFKICFTNSKNYCVFKMFVL